MTKTDSDYSISSSVSGHEAENPTTKGMNEGETKTADKHFLDSGLENDKHIATSLNKIQSISNGNIPDINGIDSNLIAKSVDVDGVKTVTYTNGEVSGTAINNGYESLNKMRDDDGEELEKDGLISDAEKENNQDESLRNAPIDRGWAWVILSGKDLKHFSHRG